jgi:uncharacterized protein (DUF1778 family)
MIATRRPVALRVPDDDLHVIDQEAQARGLSRTDYMIRASTGQLSETQNETAKRLDALEQTVARLTEIAFQSPTF